MLFIFAFLLQGSTTRADGACPVLQCIPLPPCVTHVVEISPGCPGCPVCGDIAPYTRTDSTVAVQILPDLIVTAPSFVLEQAAQLKKLVDQAQAVYDTLSDPDKAVVDKAVDKAVATALDKLYPPVVPSNTKEEAVNNALTQIATTQPASPILTAIKAIVNSPATAQPETPAISAIKAIVNAPTPVTPLTPYVTTSAAGTPLVVAPATIPLSSPSSSSVVTLATPVAPTPSSPYTRTTTTNPLLPPRTQAARAPLTPYGPRATASRANSQATRTYPNRLYGPASSVALPPPQLLSTTYYTLDPFIRRRYRF